MSGPENDGVDDSVDFNPAMDSTPGKEIAGDFEAHGIRMLEKDSCEITVEGLREAAEGAAHLVVLRDDKAWSMVVEILDKVRYAVVIDGGLGAVLRQNPTKPVEGALAGHAAWAYENVFNGLLKAERGARQIATCHRGDLKWSQHAQLLEGLREKCSHLARRRMWAAQSGTMH